MCWSSPSTREPGVWALERAKQNVLENYLLVGILEELEDVLLLLERLLPHYFTGVLNIYKSPGRLIKCFLKNGVHLACNSINNVAVL